MFYQASKNSVCAAGDRVSGPAVKVVLALAITMLLPLLASAYTLVLRDGRRLEIPATFVVNRTTLTYEQAPGFNVTLQVSIIDIPATEQANRQPPGSFLKPAEPAGSLPGSATRQSRRQITNADLERLRARRLESEKAYEQRRRALGLPSMEEMRRQQEREAEQTLEVIRPRVAVEESREAYWRARANGLRAEVAAVEAQIHYLQSRLGEFSNSSIASVGPFIGWGNRRVFAPARPQLTGSFVFGRRGWGGQVFLNPGRRTTFGHRGRFGGSGLVPFRSHLAVNSIGRPFHSYENSYERAAMVQHLDELLVTRAGFLARWRLLEEEARRAGAYPGWLRP